MSLIEIEGKSVLEDGGAFKKSNVSVFYDYFTGGNGGEYDTYKNPLRYDERQQSFLYRRDNLARGIGDIIEDNLQINTETQALDIGAGTGILSLELARRGCGSVAALDLLPEPLIRMREKAVSEGLFSSVQPVTADMNLPLPFNDDSLDLVTSLRATRYITNFEGWLDQIHRVLKPEGEFVLPVFSIDSIPWKRHSQKGFSQPTSYKDLRQIVLSVGFRLEDTNSHYSELVDLTKGKRDVPFYYNPQLIIARKD